MQGKRVKVYLLDKEDWLDNGTGYCTGEISADEAFLVVKDESKDEVLLRAQLQDSIQYQRQQDTLIVWTDPEGKDIALSFQETSGCDLLCEFITSSQQDGLAPNISLVAVHTDEVTGDTVHEMLTGPVSLPVLPVTSNGLMDSLKVLNDNIGSKYTRQVTCRFVIDNDYIPALIAHFAKCEAEHCHRDLLLLSSILKAIILFNERSILELFVRDETIMGVVGILEYDAEFPMMKYNHREYLKNEPFVREVVPINAETKEVVARLQRLQFLKDVVLIRLMDDPTFSLLSAMIYDCQVHVIEYMQQGLADVVALYDTEDDDVKRDGIRMLHQCVMSCKSLQQRTKNDFFSSLVQSGLLKVVRFAFKDSEVNVRVLATEMISIIIEHDVLLINDVDMSLLAILTEILLTDDEPGLLGQVYEAIKSLLNPTVPLNEEISLEVETYHKDFYEKVAPTLFKPLMGITSAVPVVDDVQSSVVVKDSDTPQASDRLLLDLVNLVQIITCEHTRTISRSFVLENNILSSISALIRITKSLGLQLACVRTLKLISMLNDDFYTRYMISHSLFGPVFDLLLANIDVDNLANSTVLDLLENVKYGESTASGKKNAMLIIKHFVANYADVLGNIDYVSSGKQILALVTGATPSKRAREETTVERGKKVAL